MKTINAVIWTKAGLAQLAPPKAGLATPTRKSMPKISAKIMLEAGPAEATIASDHRPGRKLYGLYGLRRLNYAL